MFGTVPPIRNCVGGVVPDCERNGARMGDVYSLDELQGVLRPIFREYGVKKAVLFGSYAKGRATKWSDVDLLVDSGLRGLAFFGLLESVASALRQPVDLIDVTQIDQGSAIDREIQTSGVTIYG